MDEIKKILVPTDFSINAETVYPVAQEVAARFESVIDFIHVIPNVKYLQENLLNIEMPINLEEEVIPELTGKAENELRNAMDRFLKADNKGRAFVKLDRKPSKTITRHARDNGYDLIIIGAKGKDESGMFRGSTATNIIRSSTLPVLSVDDQLNLDNLKNVMLPTDTSLLSFAAFPMAAGFAALFNSDITLLHVLEKHNPVFGTSKTPDDDELHTVYESIIQQLENFISDSETGNISIHRTAEPFEDMAVLSGGNIDHTVQLKTKIISGVSAHDEIKNHAEQFADLLVLTTHGYSGKQLLDLGSNAEKIAREVEKPVITVQPAKDLFRKEHYTS
ncbi:MAG: universal stress protein [Balneolaceae bacterium]